MICRHPAAGASASKLVLQQRAPTRACAMAVLRWQLALVPHLLQMISADQADDQPSLLLATLPRRDCTAQAGQLSVSMTPAVRRSQQRRRQLRAVSNCGRLFTHIR